MKLEKIPLDKIDLIPTFNVRAEICKDDETRDLEESIKVTEGNIQPILVCQKKDRYELISGERRYNVLKSLGYAEASCIVYDNLTDLQKTQLMYNENLGRKDLLWSEEVKAVKRLKSLGFDISVETLATQKNITKLKAWNLLEALKALEEANRSPNTGNKTPKTGNKTPKKGQKTPKKGHKSPGTGSRGGRKCARGSTRRR